MKLWALAWRNIGRNRRRTTVTTAAMTLALWVTILYSGMMQGYLQVMERDALDNEVGDAQVFARGYQDRPSIYTFIPDAGPLLDSMEKEGVSVAPRWLGAGLVAAGEASAGAQFRGVDVARDARVLGVSRQVAEGTWLDAGDDNGVVLGRKLARTLGVKPGDELVLLGQATDGSMANELARVRGILRSVGEGTDRAGLFMTEAAYRRFFAHQGGPHQLMVRRAPGTALETLEGTLRARAAGLDVMTWRQLIPTLASILDSTRGLMAFMFFIVNIAIAIVVLNAMLMAVFERIREFGVLKAVGADGSLVLRLIYAESFLQLGMAVALGTGLAIPPLLYLRDVGLDMASMAGVSAMGMALAARWVAVVSAETFTSPILMMLCVVAVAVLYPAAKAALLRPVQAMKHV